MKLIFLQDNREVDLHFVRNAGGTNDAKLYTDLSGDNKYVIKFYKNTEDSCNEVLTGKLYELAGVNIPQTSIVRDEENDQYGIASEYIESFKTAGEQLLTEEQKNQLRIDGVIHAWLNNWDFIGPQNDNIGTCDNDKKERILLSIDHRCGLNGRGLPLAGEGHTKAQHYGIEAFDSVVRSLVSLQDSKINPQTAAFLRDLSHDEIKCGIERIAKIPEQKIRDCVMEYGFGTGEDKKELINTILWRRKYLMTKYFIFNDEINKDTGFEEIANLIVNAFYREEADGDESYRQMYKEKGKEELLSNKYYEAIKRLKHGGMHASRVAFLVRVFYRLYKKYDLRTDLINEEMLKMLMIAAIFHDAGRAKDSGQDRKEWEIKSYELARDCLIALGYEMRLATIVASTVFYAEDNDAIFAAKHISGVELTSEEKNVLNLLTQILHDADSMDYHRFSYMPFDVDRLNFYQLFAKKSKSAEELLDRTIEEHKIILKEAGDLLGETELAVYEKAKYEHSGQCYTSIADKMCRREFFAEHYDQFVSFKIVPALQVEDDAKNVVKATAGDFIAITSDSGNGVPAYKDAKYEYEYFRNNLDNKRHDEVTNRFGIRHDDRPPQEIIDVGGFNPKKTLIVESNSEAVISDVLVALGSEIQKTLDAAHLNRRKDGKPARNVSALQQASTEYHEYLQNMGSCLLPENKLKDVRDIVTAIKNIKFGENHPLQAKCDEALEALEKLSKWYQDNKSNYTATLDVSEHRIGAHKNTGFVSFSAANTSYFRGRHNKYLARIPYAIMNKFSERTKQEYFSEHELSVPGGLEWDRVVAYRNGESNIFIRKSEIARGQNNSAAILSILLKEGEVVVFNEEAKQDHSRLLGRLERICKENEIDVETITSTLTYYNNIKNILDNCADDTFTIIVKILKSFAIIFTGNLFTVLKNLGLDDRDDFQSETLPDELAGRRINDLVMVLNQLETRWESDFLKLLCEKGLIHNIIKGVNDLVKALKLLATYKRYNFLELLVEEKMIGNFIKGVDDLIIVLNILGAFEGFKFLKLLCEKGLISGIINGVRDLIIVLNFLGTSYGFDFLKLLCEKGLIGDFIKGVDDLIIVLNFLETFEGFNFLKLLCEKGLIGNIMKSVDDLVKVLKFLEIFLRSEFLQLLCEKELISKIIESVDDFFKLRRELSDPKLNQFIEPIGNLWFRKRVNNNKDLVKFLNACNNNDNYYVQGWLDKKKLTEELIKSAEDLVYVLLNCTHQYVVLDLLNKDWFLKHINTTEDLVSVLNALNSYGLKKVLEWLGEKLPELISSEETLVEVLEKLNEPSRSPVLDKLGTERLVELINNKDVFAKVIRLISACFLESFIDVLGGKDRVNQLIGSNDEMTNVLSKLTVLQRYVFLTKLNTRPEDRIKNVDELAEFMNQLCSELLSDDTETLEHNLEHLGEIFDALEVNEWFAKLTKNADDKVSVLDKLTQFSFHCFLEYMEEKDYILSFIENREEFVKVLGRSDTWQCALFLDSIKDSEPEPIINKRNTTSEKYPGFFDNSRTRQLIINEETSSVVPSF